MKKLIILFLILFTASTVSASYYLDHQEVVKLLSNGRGEVSLTQGQQQLAKEMAKDWGFLKSLNIEEEMIFGAVTDLATTDNLSDFPTTYNANLAQLMRMSTTTLPVVTTMAGLTTANALSSASSLATVGTVTSGTWNATAIGVTKGGSGTTSPSVYNVMLGDGASGLTTASTTGTSGQFLTSNGTSAYPSWQSSSVNQTSAYSWSGEHSFSATTSVAGFAASSTPALPLKLNGVNYAMPTIGGATSTALMTDANDNLSWNYPDWVLLSSTTTENNMLVATSTFAAATDLVVKVFFAGKAGADELEMYFNNDLGNNYGYYRSITPLGAAPQTGSNTSGIILENGATTSPAHYTINIDNQTSVRKFVEWRGIQNDSTANTPAKQEGWGVWNNTSAQITSIRFLSQQTITAGTIISVYGRR